MELSTLALIINALLVGVVAYQQFLLAKASKAFSEALLAKSLEELRAGKPKPRTPVVVGEPVAHDLDGRFGTDFIPDEQLAQAIGARGGIR